MDNTIEIVRGGEWVEVNVVAIYSFRSWEISPFMSWGRVVGLYRMRGLPSLSMRNFSKFQVMSDMATGVQLTNAESIM